MELRFVTILINMRISLDIFCIIKLLDLGSSQSSRPDRVAKASMKTSTYNLGSVKVTKSSQFYNTKNIRDIIMTCVSEE